MLFKFYLETTEFFQNFECFMIIHIPNNNKKTAVKSGIMNILSGLKIKAIIKEPTDINIAEMLYPTSS